MSSQDTGARPEYLLYFADRSEAVGITLAFEVQRLAAALERFHRTCREYYTLDPHYLPGEICRIEQRQNELSVRVRTIGYAFRDADSGGLESLRMPPEAAELPTLAGMNEHETLRDELRAELPSVLFNALTTFAVHAEQFKHLTFHTLKTTTAGMLNGSVSPFEAIVRYQELKSVFHSWIARDISDALRWYAWNSAGIYLEDSLALFEGSDERRGTSVNYFQSIPMLLTASLGIVGITVVFGVDDWPTEAIKPENMLELIERSFLEQRSYLMQPLFNRLTARMDRIIGSAGIQNARPLEGAAAEHLRDPESGVLDVSATELFPPPVGYQGGPYRPSPGALMDGLHALISPYAGENVSFAQINESAYVIGIYGLDLKNLSTMPNGLNAVALTADSDALEANEYYLFVRSRVLACIDALPPNSQLNIAGHSMGAGMSFLLLNDPQVLDALRARGVTVPSIVTLGGVRPDDPRYEQVLSGGPNNAYGDVLGGIVQRHYTDIDDFYALHVGAGHNPDEYSDVMLIDNGVLDSPTHAHTHYEDVDFTQLSDNWQNVPWTVNPPYVKKYRVPPPPWRGIP